MLDEYFKIESFFFFANVDESVLQLNSEILRDDFEFIKVDLASLARDFTFLLLPSMMPSSLAKEDQSYSEPIFDANSLLHAFVTSPFFTSDDYHQGYVIFLKRSKKIAGNCENLSRTAFNEFACCQQFALSLIKRFLLWGNGDVQLPFSFQIEKCSQKRICFASGPRRKFRPFFKIAQDELDQFLVFYQKPRVSNHLIETAEASFEESYVIDNAKIRFVVLITTLEILFNLGKDQISHTISRHVALLLSKNTEEFLENYKKVKRFYHLRSSITHGSQNSQKPNESKRESRGIGTEIEELQEIVRKCLRYCRDHNFANKEKISEHFNSMGTWTKADKEINESS